MLEIFQFLNQCTPLRAIFYSFITIVGIAITLNGIKEIINFKTKN